MTKQDLVNRVLADNPSLSKDQVAAVVDSTFNAITAELKAGGQLTVRGFGVFKTKIRAKKIGRNISKNEQVEIPAVVLPVFKAYDALKDAVK